MEEARKVIMNKLDGITSQLAAEKVAMKDRDWVVIKKIATDHDIEEVDDMEALFEQLEHHHRYIPKIVEMMRTQGSRDTEHIKKIMGNPKIDVKTMGKMVQSAMDGGSDLVDVFKVMTEAYVCLPPNKKVPYKDYVAMFMFIYMNKIKK